MSDVDDAASEIVYTITSAPTNGSVYMSDAPGVAVTSFSQADLDAGRVWFEVLSAATTATADTFEFVVADASGASLAAASFDVTMTALPLPGGEDLDFIDWPETGEEVPSDSPETDLRLGDAPTDEPEARPEDGSSGPPLRSGPSEGIVLQTRTRIDLAGSVRSGTAFGAAEDATAADRATSRDRGASRAGPVRSGPDGVERLALEQQLADVLEAMQRDHADRMEELSEDAAVWVRRSETVALAFGLGVAAQVLRSGSLVALSAAALPLWRGFDPVAVLSADEEKRRRRDSAIRYAEKVEDETGGIGRILDSESASSAQSRVRGSE